MSSSSDQVVRQMLYDLHQTGRLKMFLHELEPVTPPSGTMSDASKRRMDFNDEDGFSLVSGSPPSSKELKGGQKPLTPRAQDAKPSTSGNPVEFPEGIFTLQQWGATICALPKYADREWSYAEMVEVAKTTADIAGYLVWVRTSGNKSPLVQDLKAYLHAINWEEVKPKSSGISYPGSSMVRRFK